jgi:hypothetical protein
MRPKQRPDGASVVDKPPVRSSAEKKGIQVGDEVTYQYAAFDQRFRGSGVVFGFVHNKNGSPHGDVAIEDSKLHSYVFVDSKNVFKRNHMKAALLTEDEVRAAGRRYIARLANIRRMGRALAVARMGLGGRPLENPAGQGMDRENTGIEAVIQVNKGYKPRRLKMDGPHMQQRRAMKKVRKKPQWKQHHKKVVKKYMQKFGKQLKKRSEKVRQIRKQRHL